MTKRNPDLDVPMTVSFVADYKEWQEFRKLVGEQNASKEIRAMVRDRVKLQKNEQARAVNPLNLISPVGPSTHEVSNNNRQTTLFESFVVKDRRNEIVDFVHSIKDTQHLNQLETNAKCMLKVSQTHRMAIIKR